MVEVEELLGCFDMIYGEREGNQERRQCQGTTSLWPEYPPLHGVRRVFDIVRAWELFRRELFCFLGVVWGKIIQDTYFCTVWRPGSRATVST